MANSLREHFTISRELEYFTEAELTKQIGCSKDKWAITLVKEMVDNALDACESIGVEPHIKIVIDSDSISVQDNGPGIPENVITGSLIYSSTISDKRGYVSPSRGQQGNALKCLYAVPYVANGEQAQIEIQAHKTRYFYRISANKISQSIDIIPDVQTGDFVENGSFFKIHNFDLACLNSQHSQKNRISTKQEFISLIWKFSLCNCHATFELMFDDDVITYPATSPQQKWTLKDALVSHWYSQEQFCDLISHNINIKPDMSVNEFVKMFNGLKTSAKQKEVSDKAGLNSRDGLKQFVIDNNGKQDIDKDKALNLLLAMNQLSVPVKSEKLGLLNKDHLKKMLNGDAGNSEIYEHKQSKSKPDSKERPYTIDVVFQGLDDDSEERYSNYILCVNHTVLIDGRAFLRFGNSLYSITEGTHISYNNPVRLLVHITCPYIDFKDKGKNDIYLNESLFSDVKEKVALACKAWTKLQKNKTREQRASWKQEEREVKEQEREAKRQYIYQTKAIKLIAEDAYTKAAGDINIAAFRQVYYAARPKMLQLTGKTELDDNYFRKLLRKFMKDNPDLTSSWDVVFDARGTLIEPHTKTRIPMGTVKVREYIRSFSNGITCDQGGDIDIDVSCTNPSFTFNGFNGLYKYVLFIEKEGFEPILAAANIPEIYDIAIMSTKGMSNVASRELVELLNKNGVKILVLHDFDIAGFNIARTLGEDTETYQFTDAVELIDIGLRLEDIAGLERERVYYKKQKAPRQSAIKAGATKDEAEILVQNYDYYKEQWWGERVELNALTAPQLIEFLKKKFEEHGVKKVVPENEVLEEFYKATHKSNMMDSVVDTIQEIVNPYITHIGTEIDKIQQDVEITPPDNLQQMIKDSIDGTTLHWTEGIKKIATSKDADKDTQKRIEAMIKPILEEIKEKFAA